MNPELYPLVGTALMMGVAGSASHCIAMCGGIACALGLPQQRQPTVALLCYHLGRVTAYSLIALLLGGLLQQLMQHWPAAGAWLRTFAGLLLIAMALHTLQWWSGILRLETLGNRWWTPIRQLTRCFLPATRYWQMLLLGFLWGWLPCGLVYSTLLWASARGNAAESALLMASFGLGTAPALIAGGLFAGKVSRIIQQRWWRYTFAVVLLGCGGWTIYSGWRHQGHQHMHHTQAEDSMPTHDHAHMHHPMPADKP